MKNIELSELLDKIMSTIKDTTISLEEKDPSVQAAWSIRKNTAIETLEELKKTYREKLNKLALFMFVIGTEKDCDKFAHIAHREANTFTIKADETIKNITSRVEASIGNDRMVGAHQAGMIKEDIFALDPDIGIKVMLGIGPSMPVDMAPLSKDVTDTYNWTKKYIYSILGTELMQKEIDNQILNQALMESFDGNVLPIVVLGCNKMEADDLSKVYPKSYQIILDKKQEVGKDLVYKFLSTIKEQYKDSK